MLLLYAVVLGIVAGLLTKGRLSALGSVHIKLWPVALVGLVFQALLFSSPLAQGVGRLGPSLYVLSTTLVLMALVVNLRQPGFWLIIVGALLNFTAIVLNNGFMPASPDAVAVLLGTPVLPTAAYTNSALATGQTTLGFLGDIFALPRPLPFANVFSIGDVLIGLGGAWFVVRAMHMPAASRPWKQQTVTDPSA
ncbi:MAG TPA: DUF5317 domain-containing protein [Candidatus Limnocylindrales bacterium]